MRDTLNLEEIQKFVQPEDLVYVGSDSEVISAEGKLFVDYAVVVVVHLGGKHGCKIFGRVDREPHFERTRDKPSFRLMNEVYKVAELYLKLAEMIENPIEVHIDVNPDKTSGSNVVFSQALGYLTGICGSRPKTKPDSFAASNAADRLKRIING